MKGTAVFVQGELTTCKYDRKIKVPIDNGKTVDHSISQLAVELKADTIHILGCSSSNVEFGEMPADQGAPDQGPHRLLKIRHAQYLYSRSRSGRGCQNLAAQKLFATLG